MILLIDNYDSFVHNLGRYIRQVCASEVAVVRNDQIDLRGLSGDNVEAIVLSPGPGGPADAGLALELVARFNRQFPMLGVCLGHQIIVQALGGRIIRAEEPMHGKRSEVIHSGDSRLWESIPSPFQAGRYHSLIADRQQLPASLRVVAESGEVIMAVQHRDYPVYGVQFHPESVLTEHGYQLIANFLRAAGIQASIPAEAKL